jgi:tRNA (cmo5U34)-methyltransferase
MPLERDLEEGRGWVFDEDVAAGFDDMLERSIPQYPVMREVVTDVAHQFVRNDFTVVDLGCSLGEALRPLAQRNPSTTLRFLGVDASEPMVQMARARLGADPRVAVVQGDLRTWYPDRTACVTLAVLTLQFVPIEHRQAVLRRAWRQTIPGGALVVVEKVLGQSAVTDELLVRLYHGRKAAAGYSEDEIRRKALSLEGVLVPVTYEWNVELLRSAGFAHVEGIWRFLNFAAWVAIKD